MSSKTKSDLRFNVEIPWFVKDILEDERVKNLMKDDKWSLYKYMCIFLVWCFVPIPYNGSDFIYSRIIRPFFMKHRTDIDSAVNKVTDKLGDLADSAAKAAAKSE
ncbi:Receptor expression-enhancing protein 5 [Armadillidium vulgare]|nr:Receptor expression-enhancing protein 5 [Armadillidium vulgare]